MEKPSLRQIDSWHLAEQNARDWMRYWGYRDASLTPPGADSGIDVRSSRALAQVKYEARDVGRPQLQLLVGARGRNHHVELLFFTGAGYSTQAIEYAAEMGIALFKYSLDGRPSPMNAAAMSIVSRASTGSHPGPAKANAHALKEPQDGGMSDGCAGLAVLGLFLMLTIFLCYLGFGPLADAGFFGGVTKFLAICSALFLVFGAQVEHSNLVKRRASKDRR